MKKYLTLVLFALATVLLISGCGKDKTTSTTTTTTTSSGDATVSQGITNKLEIYVSPTGNALAKGTQDDPNILARALRYIEPGGTIYCAAGTYEFSAKISLSVSGEVGKLKTVRPMEGLDLDKAEDRVILDFSSQPIGDSERGIQLDSDYWYFYGLDICNAGDNGMLITGNFNTIEYCTFHGNHDSGLQIARYSSSYSLELDARWPSYNLILNCSSYNNCDVTGEDADGFAPKLTCGPGNIFDGCFSYNNVDDGWDCYTKDSRNSGNGPIASVTIRNCVSFFNGFTVRRSQTLTGTTGCYLDKDGYARYTSTNKYYTFYYGTSASDGNGFKLGGDDVAVDHLVENCISFCNMAQGYTDNSNPGTISLKNCTGYNNGFGAVAAEKGYNIYNIVSVGKTFTKTTSTSNPSGALATNTARIEASYTADAGWTVTYDDTLDRYTMTRTVNGKKEEYTARYNNVEDDKKYVVYDSNDNPVYEDTKTELDVTSAFADRTNYDLSRHDGSKLSRYGDEIESSNTFNNVLSINTITLSGDNYRGLAMYSLFASASSQFKVGSRVSVATGENATIDQYGEKVSIDKSNVFESVTLPDISDWDVLTELHYTWRNADGSPNLGSFLKVSSTSEAYTLGSSGSSLGANLSLAKKEDYGQNY